MLALALLCTAAAPAALVEFTGNLAPDGPGSMGNGMASVVYDSTAHTLQVDFTWNDLTGTTTVAHIHCCVDPPGTIGVATYPMTFPGFPMGTTSGTYSSPTPINLMETASYTEGFLTDFGGGTAAGAESALVAGLMSGRAYLNVHSTFAPGGEIRDFLQPIPEPGTMALFVVPIAVFMVYRARNILRRA
jgi:hypothetical protein